MNKEIVTFDDTEIEKRKFHYHKKQILMDEINIDKIIISSKVSSVEKNYK